MHSLTFRYAASHRLQWRCAARQWRGSSSGGQEAASCLGRRAPKIVSLKPKSGILILNATPTSVLHVVIRAVPHPAMRQTAACLARILAAGGNGIVCTLESSLDYVPGADRIAIYLRPAATDALALTATAELVGDPRLRAACAFMAGFDERCAALFCLSWESLLAGPYGTLCMLANYLHRPLPDDVWSIVDEEIGTLRGDLGRYDHPIPFVAALDGAPREAAWNDDGFYGGDRDAGVAHLLSVTAPRTILILRQTSDGTVTVPVADSSDWRISHVVVRDDASLAAAGVTAEFGIIYFRDIEAAPAIGLLLDAFVPRLATGGLLCGDEVSEAAVTSVLAKLTANGDRHELTFTLSGRRWLAIPPARYS